MAEATPLSLLRSDDEAEKIDDFSINKKFVKQFEYRKQKQEFLKAESKAKSDDDSDEYSSEDEDGDLLTPKLDTDIMKTLNALRSKDGSIYNPETRFFEPPGENDSSESPMTNKQRSESRLTISDVVRDQVLEEMENRGESDHPEEEERGVRAESEKTSRVAYDDEQKKIRMAFLQSAAEAGSDGDEEEGEPFILRRKKSETDTMADKDFHAEVQKLEESAAGPTGEVEDGERFLLNFFKNRGWIDKDRDDEASDSFDDPNRPISEKLEKSNEDDDDGDASLEQVERNDDFESRYNFRFEAAEAAGGQSGADLSNRGYARGQAINSLRRKDDTRVKKRKERRERKAAERRAKEEQLKRLKNARRRDLERKMSEIKRVLGNAEGEVDEVAIVKMLEGDFDPVKLEEMMKETYGDDYYNKEEKTWKSDSDIREDIAKDEDGALVGEDGGGDWYDVDGGTGYSNLKDHHDRAGVEECDEDDVDYLNEQEEQGAETEETELEKKMKAKMEDELYKFDYEDIIAGMPTRFKYRQVKPNNYGLTTKEILFARDATLKQYVSLKKMAPYLENEWYVSDRKRKSFRTLMQRDLDEAAEQEASERSRAGAVATSGQGAQEQGNEKKPIRRRRKPRKQKSDVAHDEVAQEQGLVPAHGELDIRRKTKRAQDAVGVAGLGGSTQDAAAAADNKEVTLSRKKHSSCHQTAAKEETPFSGKANKRKRKALIGDAAMEGKGAQQATVLPEKESDDFMREELPCADASTADRASGRKTEPSAKKQKRTKPSINGEGMARPRKKKKKKQDKKRRIEGIAKSRLSSYGL